MKGPSDALPNTLSLGGSIRTRLTETAVFTAFPTVVQFPSPPLWEAAGFSCLQTRCTFLSDISASSPGPPGRLQTAQLHLEENKHQVPIVTQMLEDHLHTHVCWVSFFSNGKSWSIFKLQRRLSKKKKKQLSTATSVKHGEQTKLLMGWGSTPLLRLHSGAWCRAQCQACVVFVHPPEGQQRHKTGQRKSDARLRGAGWLQGACAILSFFATSHSTLRQVP